MEPLDERTIRASFVNCSKGEAARLEERIDRALSNLTAFTDRVTAG